MKVEDLLSRMKDFNAQTRDGEMQNGGTLFCFVRTFSVPGLLMMIMMMMTWKQESAVQ